MQAGEDPHTNKYPVGGLYLLYLSLFEWFLLFPQSQSSMQGRSTRTIYKVHSSYIFLVIWATPLLYIHKYILLQPVLVFLLKGRYINIIPIQRWGLTQRWVAVVEWGCAVRAGLRNVFLCTVGNVLRKGLLNSKTLLCPFDSNTIAPKRSPDVH